MNLNQLYGYFGRSLDLITTMNVDKQGLVDALSTRFIDKIVTIHDNLYVLLIKGGINQNTYDKLPAAKAAEKGSI